MTRLGTLILITFTALGCSDSVPCTACPAIDGTYAVTWAADGGTAACPGPRSPSWVFTERTGSAQVITTIGDITLGGTLYDSYDLLLTGSQLGLSYRLHALVIPAGTADDAGIKLQGTFVSRTVPDTGDPCESDETFTAQRTSR